MTIAFSTLLPISSPSKRASTQICNSVLSPSSPITLSSVSSSRQYPRAVAADASISKTTTTSNFDNVVMRTYTRYPLTMTHGQGVYLFDTEGNKYIDCVAGIATCTLGHAHPALIEAVTRQMSQITHVSNLYYIPQQGALAEWLASNSPADKIFFCNSGAEANEAAIKLARKKWHLKNASDPDNVPVIITATNSFHGRTLATLTATGQPKYHKNWWPLVGGFEYVTYNDVSDLQQVVKRVGFNLAAILLESCQGEGGVHPATHEFFSTARQICNKADAMLICDEVQVGVGRTGKLWGFEHTGIQPDVFTLAKGLGGGVPIGAMCCTKACDVFAPGDHASTFGGNPLSTAAGLAITKELETGVLSNAAERGDQLIISLRALAKKYPNIIREVRGLGLICGVELAHISAADVVTKAINKGLLLVPAGKYVVRFVPPLIISQIQIDNVITIFEDILMELDS